MPIRAVKITNLSLGASDLDIKEFFSFSGEVDSVEIHSDTERSQIAFVTFRDPKGAETAVLLSGATIVDQSVTIELAPDFNPSSATSTSSNQNVGLTESAVLKAEDVVSSMVAKGFILGQDAVNKAKAFDEKHQLISTATSTVASLDQKIGFTEKISAGTTIVNDKVKEMNDKFQVTEKTKSVYSSAEQSVSSAGSAVMKNRYVLTGATWVTGAFSRVSKMAEEQKMKERATAEDQPTPQMNQSDST